MNEKLLNEYLKKYSKEFKKSYVVKKLGVVAKDLGVYSLEIEYNWLGDVEEMISNMVYDEVLIKKTQLWADWLNHVVYYVVYAVED